MLSEAPYYGDRRLFFFEQLGGLLKKGKNEKSARLDFSQIQYT
jgi:hypothetical protein